jgi:ferredoxin--NADP+ reductase
VLELTGLDYRYLEGQSLGVLTPGVDERGHANKLRLYSIASSRSGDDGRGDTAAVCVKRVVYRDPLTGEEKLGVASNYICDLAPDDEVLVTGPVGKAFLLPDDPAANLIMVATGTGIAPFRAFLDRIFREREDWTGQVRLFFGVKRSEECLYRSELDSFARYKNYRVEYAFSREQTTPGGERMYVHHRMSERIEELWELLDSDNTYMYICGIKGMEAKIYAVLEDRARRDQISWHAFLRVLQETGRLLVETY